MVSRFWRGLLTTTTRSSNGFAALSPTASWETVNYRRRVLRQTSSRRDGGQIDTRTTLLRGRLRGPLSGRTARLARGEGVKFFEGDRPGYRTWSHAQIFFARPKTFDFFFRNQKFKRRAGNCVGKTRTAASPCLRFCGFIFPPAETASWKIVAKFGGEGC